VTGNDDPVQAGPPAARFILHAITVGAVIAALRRAMSRPAVASPQPRAHTTNAARVDDLRLFSTRAAWLAGAAVGLIALAAGDLGASLFDDGPGWLSAATLTLTVLAGACAGTARVQFQWAATVLQRRIDERVAEPTAPVPKGSWPRAADVTFTLAFAFTVLAGLAFLSLLWSVAL
jgi:hypothetical protein